MTRTVTARIPELIITTASRDEWYRRNPHVQRGVLEDLVAMGVLLIVDHRRSSMPPTEKEGVF